MAFQSLMASFSEPITALVNHVGSLQTIKGGLERLEDVYNYPLGPSVRRRRCTSRLPAEADRPDRAHNVKFGYSILEPPLLDDLSIAIEPGRGWRWSAPPAAENRRSDG